MTKLLIWGKGQNDTRHTASTVLKMELPANVNAVAIAREIDTYGQHAKLPKGLTPPAGAASGHGITVVYANGRTREVRA